MREIEKGIDYSRKVAAAMTEKDLQANIIQLAHALHYLVMHTRPTETKKTYTNKRGEVKNLWATACEGDPGFPDLVLAKDGKVIFAELKSQKGNMEPYQIFWQGEIDPGTRNGVWFC